MKKISTIMAALAALLIAGCSQNEVTEVSPDAHPAVGFGVYTGANTRGVDMTTESMKDDPTDADKYGGFGIMGYLTGQDKFDDVKTTVTPSFMHNQMVKWDNTSGASGTGAWTYSPIKYWPNRENDKISFFAYAPYETQWQTGGKSGVIVSDETTKGIPYINFKLKDEKNLTKMVDLVVADAKDQQYDPAKDGKITFDFKHTLSRISFKAKLGNGDFASMDGKTSFIYITHMWIVGTNHGTTTADGNLSLIDRAAKSNAGSKFYTSAKWSELHWNYGAGDATIPEKDFSLDNILAVEKPGITESNPTAGHTGAIQGIRVSNASKAKPVSLFPENQYLYLIPIGDDNADVKQNNGCAEGDIQIGFHYDIVTEDNSTPGQFIASHAESVIKLPAGHMKRNESYLYTLEINLREIQIADAKVEEWKDKPKDVTIQ